MSAAATLTGPDGVAANERWLLPFSRPEFQAGVQSLRASVEDGWRRWADEAELIAELAGQVPGDPDGWGWKSFLREVAVARRCSDRAAAKEVFVAVALVRSHPTTLELVRPGRMPQFNALVLVEEAAGCDPSVARAVEAELAERACRLTPSRIRAEVRKIELRLDPDAAAARSAQAARVRSVRVHADRDDQATMVLSGPALPIVAFYQAITRAARAARAAGDPRGLDALRF